MICLHKSQARAKYINVKQCNCFGGLSTWYIQYTTSQWYIPEKFWYTQGQVWQIEIKKCRQTHIKK